MILIPKMSLLVTTLHGAGTLSPQVPKHAVPLRGHYQKSRSFQWNCMAGFSLTFTSLLRFVLMGTHSKISGGLSDFSTHLVEKVEF